MAARNTLSEDDVIRTFQIALRTYLAAENGSLGYRRVTLREEKTFPSDQDVAIFFGTGTSFSLHLFGLQFKTWDGSGWKLRRAQHARLQELGHVIAYAFPLPNATNPKNALHSFCFFDPRLVPTQSERLDHFRCEARSQVWSPILLASHVRRRVEMAVGLQKHLNTMSIVTPTKSEQIDALKSLLGSIGKVAADAAHEAFTVGNRDLASWSSNSASGSGAEGEAVSVPYLSWGEFFVAAMRGAVTLDLDDPKSAGDSPERISTDPCGLGLAISGQNTDTLPIASSQIVDHIKFWSQSALTPPAAVIAFESFTRAVLFIEVA